MPQLVIDLTTLVASIATAATLVLAYVAYRGSTNAQVFIEYTRRYGEVMKELDAAGGRSESAFTTQSPPESREITLAVLHYLNLCSEEFYMRRNGMLSRRVWNIWEGEINRNLGSALLLREWPKLRSEYPTFVEFRDLVDGLQKEPRKLPTA
jgi:hypothetical protein